MKLIVDKKQRLAKMRAHTATHLLHAALDKFLGGTKQAGSLVDEDYLRFDFTSDNLLSFNQLKQLENQVNEWIKGGYDVVIEEMSIEEAKKKGAKAFFADKYGSVVRVVQILDKNNRPISIELCGGTHVYDTSQIGGFKILEHLSVASGIKRIVAVTGPKVVEEFIKYEQKIEDLSAELEVSSKKLNEKVKSILKDYHKLKDTFEKLKFRYLKLIIDNLISNAQSEGKIDYIIKLPQDILDIFSFKEIIFYLRNRYGNMNFLVYNDDGIYAINAGKGDFNVKEYIKEKGLKGGGTERFVQGKGFKL